LLILVVLAISVMTLLPLTIYLSVYSSGYEGAKINYNGAIWDGYNYFGTSSGWVSARHNVGAESLYINYRFSGATMVFNLATESGYRYTGLGSEMTAVQFPEGASQTPYKTYRWELTNDDGSVSVFEMELWILEWTVHTYSVTASIDRMACYSNFEIWFNIDLQPIWYFEDQPNEVYFGVAAIELKSFEVITDRDDLRQATEVYPEASGSLLTIDVPSGTVPSEQAFYSYQGKRLNPDMFRPSVSTHTRLDSFGPVTWWDWGWKMADASIKQVFTVHTFVVGEWTVPKEYAEEVGQHEGKTSPAGPFAAFSAWLAGAVAGLGNWFANPFNQIVFWLVIAIIVMMVLAVTGVLTPIVWAALARGKKRG